METCVWVSLKFICAVGVKLGTMMAVVNYGYDENIADLSFGRGSGFDLEGNVEELIDGPSQIFSGGGYRLPASFRRGHQVFYFSSTYSNCRKCRITQRRRAASRTDLAENRASGQTDPDQRTASRPLHESSTCTSANRPRLESYRPVGDTQPLEADECCPERWL